MVDDGSRNACQGRQGEPRSAGPPSQHAGNRVTLWEAMINVEMEADVRIVRIVRVGAYSWETTKSMQLTKTECIVRTYALGAVPYRCLTDQLHDVINSKGVTSGPENNTVKVGQKYDLKYTIRADLASKRTKPHIWRARRTLKVNYWKWLQWLRLHVKVQFHGARSLQGTRSDAYKQSPRRLGDYIIS